ncbi:DNA (cytosine-5-)-methyltransferase [Clostridioides difficile]|nr:DNA (cytosine-5-)-methyltransferase [Clostridioides difficile]
MKNKEGNSVVDSIVKEFDSIGYNIHYKILNSKNYSVPQARERVIFVGTRKDIANNYEYPEFDLENEFYTVGDALVSLPNKDSLDGQLTYNYKASDYLEKIKGCGKIYNHEIPKHKDNVTYRMSLVPQGGNWKDIPEEFRAGGNHSNAYRRLDSLKPSVTIKHAYKSMIIHPIYDRCLSIREVARLQSFPDDYIFKGNKTSQYQQLANAVPPGLAVALSNSVVSYLNKNNLNIAVKKEYNKSEIQQLKDEIQLLKLEIENLKKDASTLKSSNLQIAMFDVIK